MSEVKGLGKTRVLHLWEHSKGTYVNSSLALQLHASHLFHAPLLYALRFAPPLDAIVAPSAPPPILSFIDDALERGASLRLAAASLNANVRLMLG